MRSVGLRGWRKAIVRFGASLLIAVAVGLGGLLLLALGSFLLMTTGFDVSEQPWVEAAIEHPGQPPLVFEQRGIHPMLAEYEYRVRFGSDANAARRWLPLNVGGRTRMNAYWYPREERSGPAVRLQDHWGEYLLQLDEQKTYIVIRFMGRVYAGEVTEKSPDTGRGATRTAGKEPEIRVTVGGKSATDITVNAVGQGPGTYLGRLDDRTHPLRFVPVAEAPEEAIAMVR